MTPDARLSAAIEILDALSDPNVSAERTLTNWARGNRFAGSSDRAAIRDLVYDALRCRRSYAWRSGNDTGRGLMLGHVSASQTPLDTLFTGKGFGPSSPTEAERKFRDIAEAPDPVRYDCPDWLWPEMHRSLGDDLPSILGLLQTRAPVFLRHNKALTTRDAAITLLAVDGVTSIAHALSPTAIEVTGHPRRVRNARAFLEGAVELQDAASQAVVDVLSEVCASGRVLDYCAGGGGKSLALAAHGFRVTAHDADPKRMSDIPARAARAQAHIELAAIPSGLFDVVLCDAPCSGSGAWRRQPEAKWTLTSDRLENLKTTQNSILDQASAHVAEEGVLAYATCSLMQAENADRVDLFLRKNAGWRVLFQKKFTPLDGADGFYIAGLKRQK